MADPSSSVIVAGWLQICLSFVIPASTLPRRCMPVVVRDLGPHVVHDGLVQRGLLAGERAVVADEDALGELVGDARVGLVAPQDERRDALAQRGERIGAGRGADVVARTGS